MATTRTKVYEDANVIRYAVYVDGVLVGYDEESKVQPPSNDPSAALTALQQQVTALAQAVSAIPVTAMQQAIAVQADGLTTLTGRMNARAMRRLRPSTTVAIGIGGGTTDVPVSWATPMPDTTYKVTIADPLPTGVTGWQVLTTPAPTVNGFTVRLTASGLLTIGTGLDVTVWS